MRGKYTNIAVRSLHILYIFVLRVEKLTTFEPKVVKPSARNTKSIQNLQTSHCYVFLTLQHFATKLCDFSNFNMLFLAVVVDFVLLT